MKTSVTTTEGSGQSDGWLASGVAAGRQTLTITAKVTATLGRTGVTSRVVTISNSQNGQALTAASIESRAGRIGVRLVGPSSPQKNAILG